MECGKCGNKDAYRVSYAKSGESCDKCGNLGHFKFADVFFKSPYIDENISDPKTSPHGTEITCRSQKAEILKKNGLREVGDKRHGSRSPF